jgi:hypothetical protein
MESYHVIRDTNGNCDIISEVNLDMETMQGVYTYYMLHCDDYSSSETIIDLASKSLENPRSQRYLFPMTTSHSYYSHCRYPVHISYASSRKEAPFVWINYSPGQPKHHGYHQRLKYMKPGGKAIGTKEDGVCRIVDFITNNIDSYKSGIFLMETLRSTNTSYYIYDLNEDGTTRNPRLFSRLQGFDWYGLPKELRQIIMSYNPVEWMRVSKEYYDYILPLLGNGKLDDTHPTRLAVMMDNESRYTPPQKQYIINRLRFRPNEARVSIHIMSNMFDLDIMKVYTEILLLSEYSHESLLIDSMANITYLMYLSKFVALDQLQFDDLISAARDRYLYSLTDLSDYKDLFSSLATSLLYILHYYKVEARCSQIYWIMVEASGCYARNYVRNIIIGHTSNWPFIGSISRCIKKGRAKMAKIFIEEIPVIHIHEAKTLVSEILDRDMDDDECFDIIEAIIGHESLIDADLGIILSLILNSTKYDIDFWILAEILQRPNTTVSNDALVNMVRKRSAITNVEYIIQLTIANSSVSYDNFKRIYDWQMLVEHYDTLVRYNQSLANHYRQLIETSNNQNYKC